MVTEVVAEFDSPDTVATYIGETVGTHYSAALRVAEAYGKHLAPVRDSLPEGSFKGEGLGRFWKAVTESEQIEVSPKVLKALADDPSHYFSDFLDTADAVFVKRYKDVPRPQRKKVGHTQHAECLRLLRDHKSAGIQDHFAVQNKVAGWMKMIRMSGKYQE